MQFLTSGWPFSLLQPMVPSFQAVVVNHSQKITKNGKIPSG
jgi:hypothetical protein